MALPVTPYDNYDDECRARMRACTYCQTFVTSGQEAIDILPDSTVTSGQEAIDCFAGFNLEMKTPVRPQSCRSHTIQTWSRPKSINLRA